MNRLLVVLVVMGMALPACAQDAGAMAAQQAMQDAQMANQQAVQASQQAMQDAQASNDRAMQNAQQASSMNYWLAPAARPRFSVKEGKVKPGTLVRIKCSTHYATIYYTTNGWTPTQSSHRYSGPITITTDTHLRVIAVAQGFLRSAIARVDYTVEPAPAQPSAAGVSVGPGDILHAGTPLQLITGATLDSKTAEVGDSIKLLLNEEIRVDDRVVAARGTPVDATVTLADRSAVAGVPGDLAFEVHSIVVNGQQIALKGGETMEGDDHYKRMKGLFLIPVAGLGALAVHGNEAVIKPGMTLIARVAQDTPLLP